MNLSLSSLLALALDTIKNPREGASTVLTFAPPRSVLWEVLALVVVLSVLMAQGTSLLIGGEMDPVSTSLLAKPFFAAGLQAFVFIVMILAIYHIGRAFGGTGSFEETLLLVTWLQFILLCLQVVQTVAMIFFPLVAALIAIASVGVFMWLLVNFVAVLHGFKSLGMVFVGILVSAFALLFGLSILLSLVGLTVTGSP